jgi:hydrogenase maturation protease
MTMAKELVSCYTAPILVLALGRAGAGDEGLGSALLAQLIEHYRHAGGFVEFVDGGNAGLDLLRCFDGRQVVVVLDALSDGGQPGSVSVLQGNEVLRYVNGNSAAAHPGDAREILSTAAFLGDLPEHFYVVGVRPANLHHGSVLSVPARQSLQTATLQAEQIVDRWLVELAEPIHA